MSSSPIIAMKLTAIMLGSDFHSALYSLLSLRALVYCGKHVQVWADMNEFDETQFNLPQSLNNLTRPDIVIATIQYGARA